jgi:hypothetical protein
MYGPCLNLTPIPPPLTLILVYKVEGTQYTVQGTRTPDKSKVQGTGYTVHLLLRYTVQGTPFTIQFTGLRVHRTCYRVQGTGCKHLASRNINYNGLSVV